MSLTVDTVFQTISDAANWAMKGLAVLGTDWAAIKANPMYGQMAQIAANMAFAELNAYGVPVPALVNVGKSMESALEALAAAHPGIATP